MASIFVRPDSPPPRQPSPDFLPAPLPYPHHPRRIASQPKIRVHEPSLPPGLNGRPRTLQPARSCDVLSSRLHAPARAPATAPEARRSPDFVPRHRRTLSVAFASPESSRSASPAASALDHQVPPVPAVPYRYTGPQHIVCPTPVALNKPIVLAHPDAAAAAGQIHFRVPASPPPPDDKPRPRSSVESDASASAPVPPLEKHKSMGIACLKFFGIRTASARQSPPRPAVTAI